MILMIHDTYDIRSKLRDSWAVSPIATIKGCYTILTRIFPIRIMLVEESRWVVSAPRESEVPPHPCASRMQYSTNLAAVSMLAESIGTKCPPAWYTNLDPSTPPSLIDTKSRCSWLTIESSSPKKWQKRVSIRGLSYIQSWYAPVPIWLA